MIPTDDTSSFENIFAASDSAVPLVQRESSLARIGNAFADRPGLYAPTMSAVPSASHGAPFYAPQPIPAGQPHLATVNNMHAPPVVANPPAPLRGSVHADVVHHSASFPPRAERSGHRSGHRRRERERSEPPRVMVSAPARCPRGIWESNGTTAFARPRCVLGPAPRAGRGAACGRRGRARQEWEEGQVLHHSRRSACHLRR